MSETQISSVLERPLVFDRVVGSIASTIQYEWDMDTDPGVVPLLPIEGS